MKSTPMILRAGLMAALIASANAQAPTPPPKHKKDDPTYKEALELYHKGEYKKAYEVVKDAPEDRDDKERDLGFLKVRCLRAQGEYENALETLEKNDELEPSQQGKMLRHDLLRDLGRLDEAKAIVDELMTSRTFDRPEDLLALGRAFIMRGAEPKQVLDRFYRKALEMDKESTDALQAMGDLALSKDDTPLAAENFSAGLKKEPKNADLRFGLAQAFFDGDRKAAVDALEENLKNNPNHVPSLLLVAEHHLLAEVEDKSEVEPYLEQVEKVNPKEWRVTAMRAALAQVKANEAEAKRLREKALSGREADPEIDYLIGKWLSAQMRFSEAVPFLRQSLEKDPEFMPARIALGQDLLRVGEEDEAWTALESVHNADQYNVEVYNLMSLHDRLQDYKLINRGNFIVRMDPKEEYLFGDRVLALLEQAERELHSRYGFKPSKPILIEFYPRQEDFAVRTLGFVGGDGLLGACFGLVVTMNSPNSAGAKSTNWESTLWHEYCHAVTLGQTKNRIPRWLTEGISVYEERRRDPACGEQWSIKYRRMILEENELMPLNRLNYGFVRPKSGDHMLFAYFQAGLFVEYFLQKHGEDKLREMLRDLRDGVAFSETCEKRAESLDDLEVGFFAYAKKKAEEYGGKLDWDEPDKNLAELSLDDLRAWSASHPTNHAGLKTLAGRLIDQGLHEEALKPLGKLLELFPENVEGRSVYHLLSDAHKQLKQPDKAREMLWKHAEKDSKALAELLEILPGELEAKNWDCVAEAVRKLLAINPYIEKAQRALGELHEAKGRKAEAIDAFEKTLSLKPDNPSRVHYRLAKLFRGGDDKKAKRHTLDALAESPRYREAQELLLELSSSP